MQHTNASQKECKTKSYENNEPKTNGKLNSSKALLSFSIQMFKPNKTMAFRTTILLQNLPFQQANNCTTNMAIQKDKNNQIPLALELFTRMPLNW
jgi:hypothetical protein